jgi:ribosomal protein S27AE
MRKNKQSDDSQTTKWPQCYYCAKYSFGCPFGEVPTQVINDGRGFIRKEPCDEYTPLKLGLTNNFKVLTCPNCGSHNIIGSYHDRFECTSCGKLFT